MTMLEGAPDRAESGNAGDTSALGMQTGGIQFNQIDGQNLRVMLVDFALAALGDMGKQRGITDTDKTWLISTIGKLKCLIDQLGYGGATHDK
jgi:hypothetical protein